MRLWVELSDYNEHLVEFISDLRRNPTYFSFPIILVCHKRAVQDGLAGLAAGANDIVSFPFPNAFLKTVLTFSYVKSGIGGSCARSSPRRGC